MRVRPERSVGDETSAPAIILALDLEQASAEWRAVDDAFAGFSIDLNVNTAMLRVGMTPAQVSAALAGGEVLRAMDYYNRHAA